MQKDLKNSTKNVFKNAEMKQRLSQYVLLEVLPYAFPISYQTRKKTDSRFLPCFKTENPVLNNRPEMETLVERNCKFKSK